MFRFIHLGSRTRVSLLSAALLSLCALPASANENRTKQDLTEVQQELKKNQQNLKTQKQSLSSLQQQLKKSEQAIANNAKELRKLDTQISTNRRQHNELQTQAEQLEQRRKTLDTALAAQLRSAYMVGGHDYSKLLLNQQNTAKLERTISYYDYLNKARLKQLDELRQTLKEIEENQLALAQNREQLEQLRSQEEQQRQQLLAAKSERQAQVLALQSELNQLQSSIAYLKDNEQTLITTIEELEQTKTRQVAMLGLGSSKGKLNWPTRGSLKHRFGTRKRPGFNWKGVVINAKEGSNINSIEDGQVVFADWLKGFGWVMVVDHGKGYMSLYGHAQALLKEVGDQVYQGETIALVGQSGGQIDPGLYFEIRHKGRAVNPTTWCRSS
ncbi:murein hydrolase activator EnvC family protein [Pseudoalteromonas sp. T1lg48]|uniref:murein hydrolase activator EnvC family protein n=1 Tax=Pseudoalteromonas sp. T1lg48 TaxID=2077100 RepID=UPI000CF6725B|nr:peptidoglycan DD-metalloendopeptidase family protein [Pseudoalteromonas sp. T1lg48]